MSYQDFQVTTDHRGVTTVSLDLPDHPMNVCDRVMMEELESIVSMLETSTDTRAVVFRSGKESGFLAGADINAISEIESTSEAMEVLQAGQQLYDRIEKLKMPTIAAIHGPCLGGGLELALACDHRVARDDDSTKIGFPEIMLGLIPGWGGTQRLPRTAGLANSLPMILTGKQLGASQAYKCGLIDKAIRPEDWQSGVEDFAAHVISGRLGDRPSSRRPWWQRVMEATSIGRRVIFRAAEKGIGSQGEHYPALHAALRAVRQGYMDPQNGYVSERKEFAALLSTSTSQHLIELYFAHERARTLDTWSSVGLDDTPPIRKVGVVGAGAMGAGIGHLAATRGYEVVFKEIDAETAAHGKRTIDKMVHDFARRKGWSETETKSHAERIVVSHQDRSLADCDLVVEAVVEREDVKDAVFAMLDAVVKPGAMLTTNTSSLSVTRMANVTSRAGQVAGLHFFNPVHRMELVEVVRAAPTDDLTIARLTGFVKALGKTPVVTTDTPGFLVNRVLFPYLGEAVLMIIEGHDVKTVDKEIRRFGMPMGPLELLDQVGLDVALHIARSMENTNPEVAPVVTQFAAMVDAGMLGKKCDRGYYQYNQGKRGDPSDLPGIDRAATPVAVRGDFEDDGMTPTQRRLIYSMLIESIKCFSEGVVKEAWAIDAAMVLGTGFAPHRGGPLHVVDAIGATTLHANVGLLCQVLGDRFAAPTRLVDAAHNDERFFETPSKPQVVAAS